MVIEKLLTDEDLRVRFAVDPIETVAELFLRGFELTRDEVDLFCRTDAGVWFSEKRRPRRAATLTMGSILSR
jgi:hypothetical protein